MGAFFVLNDRLCFVNIHSNDKCKMLFLIHIIKSIKVPVGPRKKTGKSKKKTIQKSC